MEEQPLVILAQDTTEVDFTRPEKQVEGAGPLDGSERRGIFLHPLMGFTPDGTPLGILYAEAWAREEGPSLAKSDREAKRRKTPLEEKESVRWIDTYRQAREQAERIPETQFVCTADSEADIYELLQESQEQVTTDNIHWIVRACHNRALGTAEYEEKDADPAENTPRFLRARVMAEDVLFTQTISVRGRFEHIERLYPCLAVYLIVTWRTLYVCRLRREFPDISCEAVFEASEWKSVYHVVRQEPPPPSPPSLRTMVLMVAQLGGYVNRNRTDDPGPQTIWLGLQRTHDLSTCWQTFGPESKPERFTEKRLV